MLSGLIVNIALFTTILFVLSRIFPQQLVAFHPSLANRSYLIGLMMGLFGVVLMLFSIKVNAHTILDFRQLAVVMAASTGGIVAAVIASLIIAIVRLFYFGGISESSIMAVVSILILGLVSGWIAAAIKRYWVRWLLFIAAMVTLPSISIYIVLGSDSFAVLPKFISILIIGSMFTGYLKHYLMRINLLHDRLRVNEERYRELSSLQDAVFQSATEVSIIVTDPDGLITQFNRGSEIMLGYSQYEVAGKLTPLAFHLQSEIKQRGDELSKQYGRHIDGFDVFTAELRQGKPGEREWTYVRKDGNLLSVNLIVSELFHDGRCTGFIGIATDITEKKRFREQLMETNKLLQMQAGLDGLTGISNRRSFDGRLEMEWNAALRAKSMLALIMFDIDHFKLYNDTYGHLGGDECLREVAAAAAACLQRQTDMLARYGGEEFAVIMPQTTAAAAMAIAQSIREAIERRAIPHKSSKTAAVVTVSVGVATILPTHAASRNEIIALADSALYESKQTGRNKVSAASLPAEFGNPGQTTA